MAQLEIWSDGLRRVLRQMESRPELFSLDKKRSYTLQEERTLLSAWGSFYAHSSSPEGMRQRYRDFYRSLPSGPRHA